MIPNFVYFQNLFYKTALNWQNQEGIGTDLWNNTPSLR
ncbi:hypothetical protein B8V81_0017 [Paenibacillus pasadenensis]|uniref:Uncharacterized protein n=1 Tax=Paenibacillus pasadenensis TaxID=217090 RepID=A0A2N5NC19_9BACL|nr:hypothetical protein B8V81_0017 [Paenibacillus pasadenensis]